MLACEQSCALWSDNKTTQHIGSKTISPPRGVRPLPQPSRATIVAKEQCGAALQCRPRGGVDFVNAGGAGNVVTRVRCTCLVVWSGRVRPKPQGRKRIVTVRGPRRARSDTGRRRKEKEGHCSGRVGGCWQHWTGCFNLGNNIPGRVNLGFSIFLARLFIYKLRV
jgi:hypothetical protein